MRHWRRGILIVWFVVCIVIALNAATQMFVTFAPQNRGNAELARVEGQAIERVRGFWAAGVFACSGALVVSAGATLVLGWRRVVAGRAEVRSEGQ